MKNPKLKIQNFVFCIAVLILSLFILHLYCFAADQLTITTYYPSPYGVYKTLRVYPTTDAACAASLACNKGEFCYSSTTDQLFACGSTAQWAAMGGSGGYWTQTGSNMYATDTTWNVGIGTTSPAFKLSLDSDGGIIAKGTYGSGATLPAIGQGSILIWYPYKAAFRAGYAGVGSWIDSMIGVWSTAMGYGTVASADAATAMGMMTTASGYAATAMGDNTIASSFASTAMGYSTTASGPYSTAIGRSTTASGTNSIALGLGVGANTLLNNIDDSLMIGFNSNIPTLFVGSSSGIGTTGDVGIGTGAVSPKMKLEVMGGIRISSGHMLLTDGGSYDNAVFVGESTGTNGFIFRVATSLDAYNASDPSTYTDRMALDPSGRLGVGTTAPAYRIACNGQPGANGYTLWTNYSDRRLKADIKKIEDGILEKIMKLNPSTFNYNDKYFEVTGYSRETKNRKLCGFVAQEIGEVFPDMVNANKLSGEEYLDTNLSNLPIYLVKAIQEQQEEIENLKSAVAELSKKLETKKESP